jgi:hypothetical protein
MNLSRIKHALRGLSLGQLRRLDGWLHELITSAEEADRAKLPSPRKQALAERAVGNKTYRLQSVRCGKENCKCARGKLHGPYWYSYVRVEGRIKSKYVGKRLPSGVEKSTRVEE